MHRWRHVSGIANGGEDLVTGQVVRLLNSLHAVPAPIAPSTVATSMRVPARQGLPNRTLGSIVIPG